MRPTLLRLLAKVQVDPATGCWLWTGAMSQSGWRGCFYPIAKVHGRVWRVNRLVLILHRGLAEVPKAPKESWPAWLDRARQHYAHVEASHGCDRARCINPDPAHLDWASHRANVQDQARRRQQAVA